MHCGLLEILNYAENFTEFDPKDLCGCLPPLQGVAWSRLAPT